jgi:RecA-family ATPase
MITSSSSDIGRYIEPVARTLLGDPNPHLSTKKELRYGQHGSMSIDLDKGTYYNHEDNNGGGVLDLIKQKTGCSGADARNLLHEIGAISTNANGKSKPERSRTPPGRIVATYDYTDEEGNVLYQVVRFEPKTFRQRRPDGNGGYIWNIEGVPQVPYRLPELLQAEHETVVLVEGEKDVDRLANKLGFVATCNAGGAGKWHTSLCRHFKARDVFIIPDNDQAGERHAAAVATMLSPIARSVQIVRLPNLPPKGDVSDWIEAGGMADDLVQLLKEAQVFSGDLLDHDAEGESGSPPLEDSPAPLSTVTPPVWRGTEPIKQRWLASSRIPIGDVTLYSGNGGSGKTETAVQLAIAVAADLGDWLGSIVEKGGIALLLSCEEPEANIRDRIVRICNHRKIDPYAIERLHIVCPDLEETWLVSTDAQGRMTKTTLLLQVESWIAANRPIFVGIDSIAAVFDGEAIARRQVRAFLSMLRKIARVHETAIMLLDHPSVRGMADGSGTANSVDWRNSVRAMLHLSDPDKDDADKRTLEVKKANYGRSGEKITLRWNGDTFGTDELGAPSPHKIAAERAVEQLVLHLLEQRNAEGRYVHMSKATGYAPKELASMAAAKGTKPKAFAEAIERMLAAKELMLKQYGPKQRNRLVVAPANCVPTEQ